MFIRISTIAVAAALLLTPTLAAAEGGKHAENFPMDGDAFVQKVESRLAERAQRFAERLNKSKASDEQKAKAKAAFEKGANAIRGAANEAAADGTVTLDEAKRVRQVAKGVRQKAREAMGKHRKDKRGEGKDARRGKGPRGEGKKARRGNGPRGERGPRGDA